MKVAATKILAMPLRIGKSVNSLFLRSTLQLWHRMAQLLDMLPNMVNPPGEDGKSLAVKILW
jgi:hypothetical protein